MIAHALVLMAGLAFGQTLPQDMADPALQENLEMLDRRMRNTVKTDETGGVQVADGSVLAVSSITTNGGGQVYVGTATYVNGTLAVVGIATFTTYVDIGTETIINDCGSASTCRATCSSGKRILGGRCAHAVTVFGQAYPDTTNSFYCAISNTQQLTAYAICARIQ